MSRYLFLLGDSTLIHTHIFNCYLLLKCSYAKLITIEVIQKFDIYIFIIVSNSSYLYGSKMYEYLHGACPALQSMFASTHTAAFRSKYALTELQLLSSLLACIRHILTDKKGTVFTFTTLN